MAAAKTSHETGFRPFRNGLRHAALAAAMVLAISACGGDDAEKPADAAATTQQASAAQPVIAANVAAMSVDQLRDAARAAQAEQRIYAPAGNNALEYYLALRDKAPGDAVVSSAITDLTPYAVIAAEGSIARDDFAEAKRLFGLLQKADSTAPALPRLKQSIADAEATFAQRQQQQQLDAAAEQERLAQLEEERKRAQEEEQRKAAAALQTQQQAAAQQAQQREAEQRAAEQRAAEQRAAEQRAAEQRAAEQRAAQQAATQQAAARPASSDLRAISQPPPKYPNEALRSQQSGEVVVEFTVGVDGSVTDARVVRSNPPRVFDREALAAVRRWRFQPIAAPVTTRRTIGFKPGG